MGKKKRLAALGAYISDLGGRMALNQWHVELAEAEPEGALARVDPCKGRYWTWLTIHRKGFWKLTPEEQRYAIVHELSHLVHQPATGIIDWGEWQDDLARTTWSIVHAEFNRGIELTTEHFASIIAPFMPLPPKWPK